jgi:hypothetical protein
MSIRKLTNVFIAEEIKNELYNLFSNELGIDMNLLAYQAKSGRKGKK